MNVPDELDAYAEAHTTPPTELLAERLRAVVQVEHAPAPEHVASDRVVAAQLTVRDGVTLVRRRQKS